MVLKLYAFPQSTCSRRAAAVLVEKQVPFELIVLDRATKEHKGAEYLQKQPFGQVPCIDDDGFILYESRAIGRYIATKYANQGTKLIPTDPKEIALFEQAASIENNNFDPMAFAIYWELSLWSYPDQNMVDTQVKKLDAKLDAYDVILSKQKYLAGNEFTLADLFHLPFALALFQIEINIIDTKPNVARWYKDISSRPAWQSVANGIKSTV
ncbi:hypothetical protein C0995_014772 [Termitomyces sp. Mi166|nr:hypothetical protein C0995_014772 [Termitomyces sp. Mi166\